MSTGPQREPNGVLFCPFCREPFEGLSHCPTHELALVAFRALPPDELDDDAPLPVASPRLGRGALLLGAALTLLAFLLPLARLSGDVSGSSTLLALARAHDVWLWLVPMSGAAQLVVLRRRRTPRQLRGSRVFVLLCAVLPSIAVAITWLGARDAAALLATRTRAVVHLELGVGAFLVWLSALPMLIGGLRLGVPRARRVVEQETRR